MRLVVNNDMAEFSGIGVMQRELYPRLEALGIDLVRLPEREPSGSLPARFAAALKAVSVRLPRNADRFFSLTTPLPLRLSLPTTTLIHDLRWLRIRGGVARRYRALDLRHAVRSSHRLVTISARTADDIRSLYPSSRVEVVHPGPGQVDGLRFDGHVGRDVLLIGRATHKRNLLAAEMIRELPPGFVDHVIGVNLADDVRARLVDALGASRCEFHRNVSRQQLGDLYARSLFSVQLSVEEGFGMPYIEALSMGCVVVAVDQPLTRELLERGAVLVEDGDARSIADQLARATTPAEAVRRAQASRYSWDSFAAGIARILME